MFLAAGFRTMDQFLLLHRPRSGEHDRLRDDDPPPLWVASQGTLVNGWAATGSPEPATAWHRNLAHALEQVDVGAGHDVLAAVDLLAPGASERCAVLSRHGFDEIDLLRTLLLA